MTAAQRIAELRATALFYADRRARHLRVCECGDDCEAGRALAELVTETRARLVELMNGGSRS